MNRDTEIALGRELAELHRQGTAFLDETVVTAPVEHYLDEKRFELEREKLFMPHVQPAVHSSELPGPDTFLRREIAGLPLLFTRDRDGVARAFYNVCRHRGTRLVEDITGCARRFTCPYHAWTWNTAGELIAVPHQAQGFPALDRADMGLKVVGATEQHGWIWITPGSATAPDVDAALAGLGEDFTWCDTQHWRVVHTDVSIGAVNWKILVEGGLEAYHFRVAHRDTIAPYFHDNLSSYQCFGPHLRSVLARRSLTDMPEHPGDDWRLRNHAQLLYSLFPTNQLLVQPDHAAWIQQLPRSATETEIRINTLAPQDRLESAADQAHWQRNHDITVRTLREDFAIGQSIQAGLASGANTHLTFGRFEGALAAFNAVVDRNLQL